MVDGYDESAVADDVGSPDIGSSLDSQDFGTEVAFDDTPQDIGIPDMPESSEMDVSSDPVESVEFPDMPPGDDWGVAPLEVDDAPADSVSEPEVAEEPEPFVDVDPAEVSDSFEPVESADSVEPVTTFEPVEPQDVAEPLGPVEPQDVAEPLEPVAEPIGPLEPVSVPETVEPSEIVEQPDPIEPAPDLEPDSFPDMPIVDETGETPTDSPEDVDIAPEPLPDLEPADLPGVPVDQDVTEVVETGPEVVPEGDVTEAPELIYDQGVVMVGDVPFEGTCGPTTVVNSVNSLLGSSELTQEGVVALCAEEGLCEVSDDPAMAGGTSTQQLMDIYERVAPGQLDVECYEYEDALDQNQIAAQIESGSVVNVAVDAYTLWGQGDSNGMFDDGSGFSNHWVEVQGVHRDETGAISGFDIVDSGGGMDYVDAELFDSMCYGYEGHVVDDPTTVVVSKKA